MWQLTQKQARNLLIWSTGMFAGAAVPCTILFGEDGTLSWRAVETAECRIEKPAAATGRIAGANPFASSHAAKSRDGFDPRLIVPAAYRAPAVAEDFDPQTQEQVGRAIGKARNALHTDAADDTSIVQTSATEDAARDAAVARGELIVERYPNRAIKIERAVTQDEVGNFQNHGPWQMWSPSGELVVKGEFHHGVRQGTWTRWHYAAPAKASSKSSGSPLSFTPDEHPGFERPYVSRANFDNDRLSGPWIVSDSRGRKIAAWEFRGDAISGLAVTWHANGRKARQLTIKQGVLDGEWTEWDADGKITSHKTYIAGRQIGPQVETYPTGEPRGEGPCLFAPQTVKASYDFWNGVVDLALVRGEGQDEKHGKWTCWHQNGGKQSEGLYEHNLRVGEHTWWYENGQVKARGEFVDGKQHGDWMWWHENGMKKSEGAFLAGVQHGTWMTWNEAGQVSKSRYAPEAEPDRRAMYAENDSAIEINPGQRGSALAAEEVEEPEFARAGYESRDTEVARRRDVRQVEHRQIRASEESAPRRIERTAAVEERETHSAADRARDTRRPATTERGTSDAPRRSATTDGAAPARRAPVRRQPTLRELAEETGMSRDPERTAKSKAKTSESEESTEKRSIINRITFGRFDKPESEEKE